MTLKLPVIKQQWCLEAIDSQYKESLHRDRQKTKKSSSTSPYTGPDLNTSGSYSSCQQPAEASNNRQPPPGADNYRSLERKLEREREKRTHGETSMSRVEPKVLPEESSQLIMDTRRNGFRLASNGKSSNATRNGDQNTASSGPYRTISNRDVLSSMGTLTVASTPSSAALRGHSIGFGSRDMSVRSPTQRSKTRGGMIMPMMNDKLKNTRYSFVDPVHSASPSFQQRLSELAALESDTLRYERTKRIKKRSKQENQ